MGSYNSQYESYYSTLMNKRKNNNSQNYIQNRNSGGFRLDGKFFIRRLIQDLIGVVVLSFFVITCKLVVTPHTQMAYNYSKSMLDKNYDIIGAVGSVKELNYKSLETSVTKWLEDIKVKITGTKSIQDKIKSSFVLPISGNITSSYGKRTIAVSGEKENHEGIDIDAKVGSIVVSSSDGRVKECGEDGQLGKYILIDHGMGIETKYGHLSEVSVKVDDKVSKEQVIGKSGNTGKSAAPHLHFELIYMEENVNPEDYFSF
jgi:murein DD-endopeptidase MepM/ murein hydrolase activator NlpD